MNPHIESPSHARFEYFTPELYLRFSSPNKEVASQASEEWETANQKYYAYLETILPRMTAGARKLAEFSCLHDAEIVEFAETSVDPEPTSATSTSVKLLVRNEDQLWTRLGYVCWAGLRQAPSPLDWPTPSERIHWVLDEFKMVNVEPNQFLHRILFSDGRQIEIPMFDVIMHTFRT